MPLPWNIANPILSLMCTRANPIDYKIIESKAKTKTKWVGEGMGAGAWVIWQS